MGVDQVDIVKAKSLQGCVHALKDVLPRQALVVHGVIPKGAAPVKLSIASE
jgi:hypothetical protein